MNTKRITTEIAQAADAIRAGQLVAVPTETVYGLAGNGLDPAAVAQIYEIKGRPAVKPLSLMVHDASAMARYCASNPGRLGWRAGSGVVPAGAGDGCVSVSSGSFAGSGFSWPAELSCVSTSRTPLSTSLAAFETTGIAVPGRDCTATNPTRPPQHGRAILPGCAACTARAIMRA